MLLADEVEVDVLERRAPDLERLELEALGQRTPVSSCSARVGSSVSSTTSSPRRGSGSARTRRSQSAPRASRSGRSRRHAARRRDRRAAAPRRGSGWSAGSSSRARGASGRASHAFRRAAGSKPVVGSSRKTSSGSPTSATPRSSRRFCPPERVLTCASRFSTSPTSADHLVDVARLPVVAGEDPVHLAHGQDGQSSDCCRTTPIRSRNARSLRPGSKPSTRTSPASRCR